jgi:choline transporter-like protein 2/4/5
MATFITWVSACVCVCVSFDALLPSKSVGLSPPNPTPTHPTPHPVYGTDYQGSVCSRGTGGSAAGKYVTFPRLNHDYVANFGVTNPLALKFYGICLSACPAMGDIVCNYDSTVSAAGHNPWNAAGTKQYSMSDSALVADKKACLAGTTPTTIAPSNCTLITSNCWYTVLDTENVYYRCIPKYNISLTQVVRCSYPTDVTDASDPRCILSTTTQSGYQSQPAKPNKLFDQLNASINVYGRYFGDLEKSWWVILVCALGIAAATAFVFVQLIKTFVGCMVWTIIALVLLLEGTITGYFYYMAGFISSSVTSSVSTTLTSIPGATNAIASLTTATSASGTWSASSSSSSSLTGYWSTGPTSAYAIIAYVGTAVCLISLCIVVATFSSVRKAIDVIQLGADALRQNSLAVFVPLLSTVFTALFLVWWVFVAANLASAGSTTTSNMTSLMLSGASSISSYAGNTTYGTAAASLIDSTLSSTMTTFSNSDYMSYLLIYHFFGLLWTASFIGALSTLTVAGTVCEWYFSEMPKDAPEELQKLKYPKSRVPCCSALYRTFRYYLGTAAAGSLLIALIQFMRVILAYISYKLKDSKSSVVKFFLCCLNSCLACIDCCVQILTRNAFIFAALKGDGFLGSGRRVFSLIFAHGTVFAVVNVLGHTISFLGKLVIAIVAAYSCYAMTNNLDMFKSTGAYPLTETWLPTLVTLFFGYVVGAGLMSVFDLAVDTVLVCYCTDCDENEKNGGGAVPVHFKKDVLLKLAASNSSKGGEKGEAKSNVGSA